MNSIQSSSSWEFIEACIIHVRRTYNNNNKTNIYIANYCDKVWQFTVNISHEIDNTQCNSASIDKLRAKFALGLDVCWGHRASFWRRNSHFFVDNAMRVLINFECRHIQPWIFIGLYWQFNCFTPPVQVPSFVIDTFHSAFWFIARTIQSVFCKSLSVL